VGVSGHVAARSAAARLKVVAAAVVVDNADELRVGEEFGV